MKKLHNLEVNTNNAPSGGKILPFIVKGDVGAVFSLIVTNEDPKYYNFTDGVFQTTQTRLKNIEIPSSGVYSGLINIPSVSDDDQYDIRLFAEAHFDTYFNSAVSKIPILTKTIYQYTDTTVTFSIASKEYSGRYKTMPTVVEVEGFRGNSGNASINWTVEAQPAVADTFALKITRQPLSSDFEVMQTVTINGTTSSSKEVIVDDLGSLAIGMTLDKIHTAYQSSNIATITALNTATKTITFSIAKSLTDGQDLIFVGKGDIGINSITSGQTNVSFSSQSIETFDFTTTVNNAAEPTSTSITVDDTSGIRGDDQKTCTVSGIGFDNTTEQFVTSVNNSTKVIVVTSAQTLKDNTILTFKGCANTATIKTKIRIDRIPDSNLAIVLDLDNILTASTS